MKALLKKYMHGEVIEVQICKSKDEGRKKGNAYKSKYTVGERVESRISFSISKL